MYDLAYAVQDQLKFNLMRPLWAAALQLRKCRNPQTIPRLQII